MLSRPVFTNPVHLDVKPPHRKGECCGYAPSTKPKRFGTVKAFFSFCVSRDWIAKDPAKAVKAPKVRHFPTLPFSDTEIENLLWAVDTFREIHRRFQSTERKPRAMILLLLHSGIRITDGVVMKPHRIRRGSSCCIPRRPGRRCGVR